MNAAYSQWRRFCRQRLGLPLLLAGLSVCTAVTTVRMMWAPAATPWPRWMVPKQLVVPGYEVSVPVDQAAAQTRSFSHGPVRRFVLRAKGQGPSFVLTLVAVRGRELGDLREMVFGRSDASADPSADASTDLREPLEERRLMRLGSAAAAAAEASEQHHPLADVPHRERRRCRERRSARRACREADGCRALAKPAPQVARPSGG